MNDYLNTKELYHHGVKGMRWGVRKDYTKSASDIATTASKAIDTTKGSIAIRKDYSKLTDAELQKRVNRLNLERSYGDLSGDTKYVKTGKEKAREILQTVGATLAIASTGIGIYTMIKKERAAEASLIKEAVKNKTTIADW